jgi:hypothetical protein
MHPFGFFAALLAADAERTHKTRRPVVEENLPAIDDATLRAWHRWALGDRIGGRATLDTTGPSTAAARLTTSQQADRPA